MIAMEGNARRCRPGVLAVRARGWYGQRTHGRGGRGRIDCCKNVFHHNFLTSDPISTILSSICTPDRFPCVWWPVGAWRVHHREVRIWTRGRGLQLQDKYFKPTEKFKFVAVVFFYFVRCENTRPGVGETMNAASQRCSENQQRARTETQALHRGRERLATRRGGEL